MIIEYLQQFGILQYAVFKDELFMRHHDVTLLARTALKNPAVRPCYCSEKEFSDVMLSNFMFW
jgi:hypothetical protein